MVITQPSHLNTGLFSLVFRCQLNTGPFANQTTFKHLNTGLVRYSDGYCIAVTCVDHVVVDCTPQVFSSRRHRCHDGPTIFARIVAFHSVQRTLAIRAALNKTKMIFRTSLFCKYVNVKNDVIWTGLLDIALELHSHFSPIHTFYTDQH